jgi:hypothetical protein
MYGAKHTHFIYSFEGERKKSQLERFIQEVITHAQSFGFF